MIKAGSLFYAVVLSLVVSILTSSILLLGYNIRFACDRADLQRRLMLNANSGIQLLLSSGDKAEEEFRTTVDLFDQQIDSVELSSKNWGVYRVICSKAIHRNEQKMITAFCGSAPKEKYCIWMADHNRPLAVCGNTLLKGDAFLPAVGVKRGFIEGQEFNGTEMVKGEIRKSTSIVPPLAENLITSLRDIFSGQTGNSDSLAYFDEGFSDTLVNDFNKPTITFFSGTDLNLSQGFYYGNIVFVAKGTITVSHGAVLHDVLLTGRKIILQQSFRGNLQAFARDSVLLEKDVTLSYPSALGVIKSSEKGVAAVITTGSDSIFGSLLALKGKTEIDNAGVILEKDCFLEGEIYTDGFSAVSGVVHGSLTCSSLLLRTPSSVYENHILNATIDALARPVSYAGMCQPGNNNIIIKYLR
ncbi:MAG: hypothetical protein ACJ77K_06810 [Bacteroidia bacterium]